MKTDYDIYDVWKEQVDFINMKDQQIIFSTFEIAVIQLGHIYSHSG